jgi:hypothetical protein
LKVIDLMNPGASLAQDNFFEVYRSQYVVRRAFPDSSISDSLRARAYRSYREAQLLLGPVHIEPTWSDSFLDIGPATGPCVWHSVGPTNINGRVTGIAFDPERTDRIFATTVGGIWRSLDAGRRWHRVSDNLGMRGVLDILELLEALHDKGIPTPLDHVKRIIVFVVNSLSSPPTNWDESENPPGTVDILLKAAGTPIDQYSYESVELLRDTAARWATLRRVRDSAAMKSNKDPAVAAATRVPDAEIYAIDVSFAALKDENERAYLNRQPTTFVLSAEAVDRLRAAAGTILAASPEFQRLLKDIGAKLVEP